MAGYNYGNLDNAEEYIDLALSVLSEDFTLNEIDRLFNILESTAQELRQLKDELEIPDSERAW